METIITINLIATIILGIAMVKAKSIILKKIDSSDDLILKMETEFSYIDLLIKKEFSAIKREIELSKKKITSNQTDMSNNQNVLNNQFNHAFRKLDRLEEIIQPITNAKEILNAQNNAYNKLKKEYDILMGKKGDNHLEQQLKAVSQNRNTLQEEVHDLRKKLKALENNAEVKIKNPIKKDNPKNIKVKEKKKVGRPSKKIQTKF
jgi:hypothetical protein